jgi:hypothetical protein
MIEAYKQTIEDFLIQLRNLKWWEFREEQRLKSNIKYYTNLLEIELLKQ